MASSSCPTCGNPLRPGAKFCASCGAPIAAVPVPPTTLIGDQPQPAEAPHIQGNVCPNCSATVRPGAKFCPACGVQIQVAPTHYAAEGAQLIKVPESSKAAALSRKASARFLLFHGGMIAILAACLVISLSGTLILDLTNIKHTPTAPVITPLPADFGAPPTARPDQRAVSFLLSPTGRFGLFASGQSLSEGIRGKLLTFSPMGETNNTRLWIDGQTPIFGEGGSLAQRSLPGGAVMTTWHAFSLTVTQTLEIVIGSENLGDTLRIRYDIQNADQAAHEVGLRLILDTLIGKNDGVPFVIPGQEGITQNAIELLGDAIPDSIRALENPELANPGVIVNLTLRGGDATRPDRVTISGWLDSDAPWDPFLQVGGAGAPLKRGGDQTA